MNNDLSAGRVGLNEIASENIIDGINPPLRVDWINLGTIELDR